MATQVKLYIEPEQTIRRFNLDGNATYETLKQRVEALVGHANFRILWQDNEKDFVVLGSADELTAAKEVLTNNLLRLFVRATASAKSSGEKKVHRGITCDGCQGSVAGARYKCLECVDYDLCEACHGKGTHQEHDMLLIRVPRSCEWKKLFVQGYGSRKGQPTPAEAEAQGPCGGRRHCGPRGPGHHRAGFGPFGAGPVPGFGPFGAGPMPGLGPFGGPFGPQGAGPSCGRGVGCRAGNVPPFIHNMAKRVAAAAAAASTAAGQTVEMDLDLNRPVADIIADVTQKIIGAINKTQTGDNGTAPATASSDNQSNEQTQMTEQEKKAEQEETDAIVATVTAVGDAVTDFVEGMSKAESEHEWTHLEAEGVDESAKQPAQSAPSEPNEKSVKDQRVESALRAMEDMGFSNEGTLLRRLLENYNGDIARVLDTIK